jgi:hypothetical protein
MACSFFRSNFAPWPFICYHLRSSGGSDAASPFHRLFHNSLAFRTHRSDPLSWTAVITAQGDNMNTSIAEATGTAQATATGDQPKPNKKASVARQSANVPTKKAKSAKKASPPKKAPKGQKKATPSRDGSKTAKVLDLLKRSGGVSMKELLKATGWQAHSVRGFISLLRSKGGEKIESSKSASGERTYKIGK